MSPDFVRYEPEIETIDPNIDEVIAQVIEFWEKKGRESPTTEGTGHAVRGAHAKALGDRGMARNAVSLCDCRAGTSPAPGHLRAREFRQG